VLTVVLVRTSPDRYHLSPVQSSPRKLHTGIIPVHDICTLVRNQSGPVQITGFCSLLIQCEYYSRRMISTETVTSGNWSVQWPVNCDLKRRLPTLLKPELLSLMNSHWMPPRVQSSVGVGHSVSYLRCFTTPQRSYGDHSIQITSGSAGDKVLIIYESTR
jgi:hypothetical protein